jgi:hypothetical protein
VQYQSEHSSKGPSLREFREQLILITALTIMSTTTGLTTQGFWISFLYSGTSNTCFYKDAPQTLNYRSAVAARACLRTRSCAPHILTSQTLRSHACTSAVDVFGVSLKTKETVSTKSTWNLRPSPTGPGVRLLKVS